MNLLPITEKEELKQKLKTRSWVVMLLLVVTAFILGLVMLVPSYFLALGNFSKISSENQLSSIEDEELIKTTLSLPEEINNKLQVVQAVSNNTSAGDSIINIMKFLPRGVIINSIVLNRNQESEDKKGTDITVAGTASTRDALMTFSNSLKSSNLFSEVLVPVSSLTRDKNLPFSIKLFIKN
jgi:Tfp pilus assembly protein PilN